MRPFLDKVMPEAWEAAEAFSGSIQKAVREHGLAADEAELIKVRVSQLNGCSFCLDLHSRQARQAGVTQQKLDLLPGWRETPDSFTERETAVLVVAEAATKLPLSEEAKADLAGAQNILSEEEFVAAEWVAVAINAFNRISILSQHPVRPRDADGKVVRE